MSSSKPIVAIRGSGAIGMRHARVLSSLGAGVVVVPVRPERVAEVEAAGFAAVSPDRPLPSVDGVIVCTRTAEHTVAALADKVPVLMEKPLAVDAQMGTLLVEAAAKAEQKLHVAYCLRFNAGIHFLLERLPALGRIDAIDAECFSWLPGWRPGRDYRSTYSAASVDGGVMRDLSHEIDLLNLMVGAGRCVAACVDGPRVLDLASGVDESVAIVTEHEGVRGTVRLSFARRPESRRLRVFGREGCLEWDAIGRTSRFLDVSGKAIESCSWDDASEMYMAQARAWLVEVNGGHSPVLATGQDGLNALRIIDDARAMSQAHGRAA